MTWVTLLLLFLCPLMMLFCMKGMSSGHKDKNTKSDNLVATTELQDLQIKMADLMEQNHNLTKEIQFLKEKKNPTAVIKEVRVTDHPLI